MYVNNYYNVLFLMLLILFKLFEFCIFIDDIFLFNNIMGSSVYWQTPRVLYMNSQNLFYLQMGDIKLILIYYVNSF